MQRHKVPFVLASSAHGPVILFSLDWSPLSNTHVEFGTGLDILVNGEYDVALISMTCGCLEARRLAFGPGVVALDCGANIGIFSMEWARSMEGFGSVIAFEPQERLYYALAGNIALNNLFNVRALNKAVGASCGIIEVPDVDFSRPSQVGGVSLLPDRVTGPTMPVELLTIDSLNLPRLDFLKLDIEGMELDALEGARATIDRSKPFILAEWHICGKEPITKFMKSINYQMAFMGMNVFCGPPSDVMSRLIEFSKQTDKFHVGPSGSDIREGANSGQGQGQQNRTGTTG